MTRKKNKFLAFCFSLIPGAGEMYLGFMKQGVSLMGAFALIWAVSGMLDLPPLIFAQPVIWFYSFFHVHNLNSLPDEEFYAIEDDFLFHKKDFPFLDRKWLEKNRRTVAAVLIVFGITLLWNYLLDFFYVIMRYLSLSHQWYGLLRSFGTFSIRALFSICVIVLGVHLVKNKKQELQSEDTPPGPPLLPGGDDRDC